MSKIKLAFEVCCNCLSIFTLSTACCLIYKIAKNLQPDDDRLFLIENKIYLKPDKEYSKEEIISLGRESIRDQVTKEILTKPFVDEEGNSYQNKDPDIDEKVNYRNRLLEQLIQRFLQNKL